MGQQWNGDNDGGHEDGCPATTVGRLPLSQTTTIDAMASPPAFVSTVDTAVKATCTCLVPSSFGGSFQKPFSEKLTKEAPIFSLRFSKYRSRPRAIRPPAGPDLRRRLRLHPPVTITAVAAASRALTAVASDLRPPKSKPVPTSFVASARRRAAGSRAPTSVVASARRRAAGFRAPTSAVASAPARRSRPPPARRSRPLPSPPPAQE
ncbi:hypothetical protein NL676_018359 [Syzygium grande]|nr:hypothetical protein NL676_018359 [Syzygium grande]